MNDFPEPLDSLDPVRWLVYADWLEEQDREGSWARAVGQALSQNAQKFTTPS